MKKNLKIFGMGLLVLCQYCDKNPVSEDVKPEFWNTSSAETQGMSNQILDSAFIQARSEGFIDGLVIIRNGFVVAEQYYNGYNKNRVHNIMSVSKSFLSAITGIAVYEGFVDSLEINILNYFPEYLYPEIEEKKYDVTIRHLLTMRMGIPGESEDDYRVYREIYNSKNWIQTTLEYPLVSNPGEKMRYNTFQTHLLSAILTKATGMTTLDFATKYLFKNTGIKIEYWEQDPQGYYFGGNAMYCTPREMAILGYLYLEKGRLNGLQIIPQDWVELTLSPSTNFGHPNQWGTYKNYNYAYLWWLGEINEHKLFMGYGYGGQFVVVFPGLNLIVVSTAKNLINPEVSNQQEWIIFDIISEYILPAIRN